MSDMNRKQKARRSSILKPPKPRNPLSDVDLNPPIDITIKSRRVSFANVHFKKEFSSDPETNTIWHNSYEEEMNKSDKSDLLEGKNAQQVDCNNENMNMSIRCVSDSSDDKNDISPSNDEDDMNMSVQDMSIDSDIFNRTQLGNLGSDLSDEIVPQNKRKTILFNQMPEDEQNMEVTRTICPISLQNNIKPNRQTIFFNKESENLDVTEHITANLEENIQISYNKINNENENTGKITQVVQNSKGNRQTIYFHSGNMDITEHIPSNLNQESENIVDHKIEQENIHLENKGHKPTYKRSVMQQPVEINMEMTENITTKIRQHEMAKSKRRTVMFNEMQEVERNMDITQNVCSTFQYNEMENVDITASVSRTFLQNLHQQKYLVQNKPLTSNETILYNQLETCEQDMEITQNVFPNLSQTTKQKNRNTIHFTEDNTENIEITKSVPPGLIHKLNQQKYLVENKPVSSHETILYNQLETREQDMEITQNVFPNLSQVTKQKNRNTINFTEQNTENIEITESVPHSIIQKINQHKHLVQNKPLTSNETIMYNQLEEYEQDMEITQNIFPNSLQNTKQTNRNTIHFTEQNADNVDITESVPFVSIQKQKLLVENKENIYSMCHIKNIPQRAAEEEEQSIEMNENKIFKKRQTIHFNETITDITESVPYISIKKQKLLAENRDNEAAIYQTKPILYDEKQKEVHNIELKENIHTDIQNNEKFQGRQTIYCNISNLEPMDITKSVPFSLVHQNLPIADKENVQYMEMTQNIATNNVQNNHKQKSRQTIHFNESITDITESVPYISIKKHNIPVSNKDNESAMYQTKSVLYDDTKKQGENNEKLKERQTINCNTSNLEAMDITKSVPFNILHQTLPVENKENVQYREMTQNVQNNHKQKSRQTIHFNESITDITESVPNIFIKKQNIPVENKDNESAMFQTKPISYDETKKELHSKELGENIHTNIKENKKLKERQTIYFDTSNFEAMDITKSVPFNIVHQNLPVADKENAEYLEMTQNIGTNNIQNNHKQKSRQTIHFNESITDITESVPYVIKKQNHPAENKEIESAIYQTKPIPTNIQNNEKLKERQTIYFNTSNLEAMDITKSVPFNLAQKLYHQNSPIADKENEQNMEVTQNIVTNIVQNNHNLKSRQTIHFDSSNLGNLELTENIPSNLVQKMIQLLPPENLEQNMEMKHKESTNVVQNTEEHEIKDINSINVTEANLKNLDITEIVDFNLMHKNDHQQTLLQVNNVDITENISHNFTQNNEKINFNDTNIEKIEITENIPIMLNKITENIENIPSSHHINAVLQNEMNNSCTNFTQNEENADINEIDRGKSDMIENVVPNSEQEITNIENEKSKTNNQLNTNEQIIEFAQQNCTDFISENVQSIHCSEPEIDHIEITESVPANLLQKLMQKSPLEHKENVEQYENPINVTEELNLTPVHNQTSFNLTANLTTLVDSTEKLINYQIGLPSSEYSKIITDDVDKNYSIVNTSIPENLDFSAETISDNDQKMDSIISVNSSTESIEHDDECKKMLNKIKPPPEIQYFDVDRTISKLPPPTIDPQVKLFQSAVSSNLSATKSIKSIILNKYIKKPTEITFNVPQRQLEEEKPCAIFERIKKLLDEHQQHKEVKKVLTLTDKIKRIATKDKLWFLIPNTEYSFMFMKNIKFDLQIENDSEIVKSIHSTLEESKLSPVGRFVFEKLKPKVTEEKIKSSIGDNYTVFSFLDYLTQISEESMDTIVTELNKLISKYGLKIDENMNATLLFTSTSLLLAFEIKFNLNDLDHIRADLIQINQLVCTVDENALRRLVKFCPTGVEFIRKYHHSVTDYLKCLRQSKLQ